MRWNVMKWNPIKKISLLLFLYHFQQIFIEKCLYYPKSKILYCNSSLGLFLIYVCVFFTCNNNSRFVTTSFENRKWSWFSCQIILEDFQWFVAEIVRSNQIKSNQMKSEQMNPRRIICLLLNHIFEKI